MASADLQIRDPIHGFVRLRKKHAKLLATRPLQRLRGVRQLAMASLVYPGAIHTRFEHTLGVTHVAGLMATALGLDDDQIELVQDAALLHDIGHGPFSHVSEFALDRYADRSKLSDNQKKEKIHEVVTARLITSNEAIHGILGSEQCREVVQLLGHGLGPPAVRSIVSGPLDADKQDYLLRDSYFCGVQYGVFDIHQMHRSLLLEGADDEQELMIDPDGIHTVEQFVLAKYYLTRNVYRHKVRLITDQMIFRAITLGIEVDKDKELRDLYAFDGSEEFVRRYLGWDDARFMLTFGDESRLPKCGAMLSRLRERRLLKRIFHSHVTSFDVKVRDLVASLMRPENDSTRRKVESAIAAALPAIVQDSIDPALVIVNSFDIRSVRETSRNDEAGILVATAPPSHFESESTLFASINAANVDRFVDVYAPVEWQNRTEKQRLCRNVKEHIISAIDAVCIDSLEGATQ